VPRIHRSGGHWQAFSPDGKTDYVISDYALVSAVDVKTMKEVARIPVGENPRAYLDGYAALVKLCLRISVGIGLFRAVLGGKTQYGVLLGGMRLSLI